VSPAGADAVPVTVISLGGTISMAGAPGAVVPALDADDQVDAALRSPEQAAGISTLAFRSLPGAHLRLSDIEALAVIVERLTAEGQAVVITQGTDTLEEVAFCLDLLVRSELPVVVTGAMRNPASAGADGPANVAAAVAVARSGHDFGGVVVVMGDEVHAARFAAKRHATRPSAFASPGAGPLGLVVEDRVHLHVRPTPWITRPLPVGPGEPGAPSVPIVVVTLDDDGLLLDAADRADGLVLACLGGGHLPPWLLERVAEVARRVPVVAVSRTGDGHLLRVTYGFAGSERDLSASGVLLAGGLDALKARLLLLLLLRRGADVDTVRRVLAEVADR